MVASTIPFKGIGSLTIWLCMREYRVLVCKDQLKYICLDISMSREIYSLHEKEKTRTDTIISPGIRSRYLEEQPAMGIHFLRGNAQAPKGHAIFIARSTRDSRVVYSTYCLVPPIPMSLAKYLPPLFAAQIPSE